MQTAEMVGMVRLLPMVVVVILTRLGMVKVVKSGAPGGLVLPNGEGMPRPCATLPQLLLGDPETTGRKSQLPPGPARSCDFELGRGHGLAKHCRSQLPPGDLAAARRKSQLPPGPARSCDFELGRAMACKTLPVTTSAW